MVLRSPARLAALGAVVLFAFGIASISAAIVGAEGSSSRSVPTAAPRLAREPAVGVQFHATWTSYSPSDQVRVLDRIAAAGLEWVRIDVGWASFEPEGPDRVDREYRDRVDRAVDAARARGLRVLLTLWLTPGWANDGRGKRAGPDDPAEYARFLRWAADRYEGRVAAWEIWNEPNMTSFWKGDARDYVSLLEEAYPAVKAGDPDALVVLGGPAYNDTGWLTSLYDLGAHGSFDVMATHPYQGNANAPPETPDDGTQYTLAHVAAVRDLMVANGDGDLPIWFTEFGWSAHATARGAPNWQWGVREADQGAYFVRTLRWVATHAPYVTNVFWYNARAQDSGDVHLDGYGLLTHDLEPRPAYEVIREYLTQSPEPEGAPLTFDPRSLTERLTRPARAG